MANRSLTAIDDHPRLHAMLQDLFRERGSDIVTALGRAPGQPTVGTA